MPERPASDPPNAFARLRQQAGRPRLRTAVIHPVDNLSLGGALAAADAGLIDPVLVGPAPRIRATVASEADLKGIEIVDTPHSHASAREAVSLARSGRVELLMKGALATREVMSPCLVSEYGLRTERRMSHIFVFDTPAYPKYLIVTDGGLNIAPDLSTKKWIVQNAIDVARAIGIDRPKVALLSATEKIDPVLGSTIDAAALCKMADRGQITGGILDGPLAFDLAVSADAVRAKSIISPVAGDADILVVPGLEAGNMLAKQLDYLAGAAAAGVVAGARLPIILTSRSDSVAERVASAALAVCMAQAAAEPVR